VTRVALLTPTYWPEVRRGTERFAHEVGVGLTERGDDVTIVTSHKGRPATATEDGMRVIRNWRPPDGRLRRRMFEDYLTHVPFAYLSLRRGDYDVANALFPSDGVAAARWSRETGRPAVLSYMGIPDRRSLVDRRWRIRITQDAIAGARAVVALSKAAQDAFARWLGVQARQIYPPVDVETFTPGGQRAPEPTIICAGDLGEPRKRVPLLIEAFARVRRERPTARLLLDRPRDAAVAARVVGDAPGVDLVDIDDRIALRDAYRRTWVSALPSFGEAFGLVLAEAMGCGTPVVCAREGGMPEIVDSDAVGRIFDEAEPPAVARALLEALELAEDPATPAACRARAEHFSRARCVDQYQSLYQDIGAAR
jgi:glycosyltransferase involved in cell wall biosynthesis